MSNMFIQFPGITGNVTSANHVGWVAVDSVDFGVQRKVSTNVGRVSDREGSIPNFTELTLYKSLDKSTPYLFQAFCKHTVMNQVELDVCSTGANLDPYVKYTLSNVVVSSHQHFIRADATPSEEVKLNFTKISISYIGRDAAHKPSSPITAGYDLETAKTL